MAGGTKVCELGKGVNRPRARCLFRCVGLFALFFACTLVCGAARAAPFRFNDSAWEGTSELLQIARTKLGRDRVQVVATLDYAQLTPADGVLVLAPSVDLEYSELSAFLRAGGRLALLDDYGTGARLLDRFQIHRLPAPLRPARTLRHNAQLAIAVPAVQQVAGHEQGRHPIVADVDLLVTNHPTGLTHPNLTPVLKIPALGEPDVTLAVTGIIVDRGRLFAMGDPSALINLMLRYPGNRAFAEGLVNYLVEADAWGLRGGKLYLVTGDFKQRGQYGGGSGLVQDLRDKLESVIESLADLRQGGLPRTLALVLATAAALCAAVWVGRLAMRPYRPYAPRFAAAVPLVAQGGVAGRAAVLSAPSTHRSLALLELKSALEEALAARLGMERSSATDALLQEMNRQNVLDRQSSRELEQVLDQMKKAESRVLASESVKVSNELIESTRQSVLRLIAELEATRGDKA